MKRTRKESFEYPEKYYHQHKIPAVAYIPFLKIYKSTCDLEELKCYSPLSPTIRRAVENQQSIGNEFFIRGYLTIDLLASIQENHPDKPELLLSHLYIGLWKTLFTSIWEQQNTITHSKESIVTKNKKEKQIGKLKEWKRSSHRTCVQPKISQ